MKDELIRMWKKTALASMSTIRQYSGRLGETKENLGN
jgi:hypothetical protein